MLFEEEDGWDESYTTDLVVVSKTKAPPRIVSTIFGSKSKKEIKETIKQ